MRCIALLLAALTGLQAAPVYGRQDAGGAPGFDPLVLERAAVLPLASTAPKVALSLPAGEAAFYYIDLPSNVATLSVSTSGSGGDADLFVRQGIPHTGSSIQQLVAESIGTSAHGGNLEMLTVGRNDGLEPGRWWILVLNLGSTAAQLEVNASFSTAGSPFVAGIGQSGTWYEQAKTYQGLFVQYLSAAQAIVVWFTFTPEGKQAWLLGAGVVDGDTLLVENVSQSRGARFGDAFDPGDVVLEDVGDLLLTFDSCGHGYASFLSGRAAWPHEQLEITRLSGVDGLGCNGSPKASFVGAGMSGSWYNPARSGEGWLVQMLSPDLGVGYWFTYDGDGNQAWVGGAGPLVDGSLLLPEVVRPVGGRFGPGYSPSQVTLEPWGAMAMTFTGCNSATMTAIGPPAFGEYGDPDWTRLTAIAGTPSCDLRTQTVDLGAMLAVSPFASGDGDTNDPNTPNVDNDTPAQPQPLGNPQVVGGFLAASATGVAGDRFASATDVLDAYRLPITAGQTIQLVISDWNAANPGAVDFDLYLYPAGNPSAPVQTSLGTGRNEFVTVAQTGNYDIVVQAFSGHGNYVLAVSDAPAPASADALSLEDEVVPGQLVLRFDEPWDDGLAPVALYKSVAQRERDTGLALLEGQPGRPQLFALQGDAALAKQAARDDTLQAMQALGWGLDAQQSERLRAVRALKALRARGDLRYAEPNRVAHALAAPSDPRYAQQWHYPMINLPQALDVTPGSASVVVAVVDTGVNPHPDLAANLRSDLGVDMISNLAGAADGNGPDRDAADPGDGVPPRPDSFHGTHVSGTVAALANNNRGGSGVAPGVRIMPVRVLGRGGSGSFDDIANGILWAAGETVLGASAGRAADVINLSLGGTGACSNQLAEVIGRARAAGTIVVAAAGNENTAAATAPADCPGVVKVAAVGRDYLPANYSNCASVDVAAPGGEVNNDADWHAAGRSIAPVCKASLGGRHGEMDGVLSTLSRRGAPQAELYGFYNGTSMAAPHVAGVAALMRSVHPALKPADFDAMLANGELSFDPRDIGVAVPSSIAGQYARFYGNGIIDALAAVRAAQQRASGAGGVAPAALVVQPSSLDFGSLTQSLSFDVQRVGSGTVAVQSVAVDVPWLSGSGGGADGLGRYTLNVNRSGLPEADYSGRVVVQPTSGNPLVVPVSMRVGTAPATGKAGRVYALLLDAITFQLVREVSVSASGGQARMAWPDVYPGTYYLVYGTDNDNDFFICDAGEFCGFVPFGDSVQPLDLRQDTEIGFAPLLPDLGGIGAADASAASAAKRELPGRPWRRGD